MTLAEETGTRECHRCGRVFPETDFHKGTSGWLDSRGVKRRSDCKRCVNLAHSDQRHGAITHLPAEPFVAWLEQKMDVYNREWGTTRSRNGDSRNNQSPSAGRTAFAETLGTTSRMLWRILNREYPEVHVDTVDRILLAEGSTCLFELYPELYPDGDDEVAA